MKWLPWITFGIYLFAYRALLDFDPTVDSRLDGAERLLYDSASSSPALIFCLAGMFLYIRYAKLMSLFGRNSAPGVGCALLVPAAALTLWATYADLHFLLIPSFSLVLLGSAAVAGGLAALRVTLFPAVFLLLALPLSEVLINQISLSMQMTNAELSNGILNQFGLAAVTMGDQVHYDGRHFHVIEACIGLRAVQTLLMASMVYVEIFGLTGLRAWIMVLASPLIGLITNEVRILTIILNPSSGIPSVHTLQGVVMITVGVLLLAALDSILGKIMKPSARTPNAVQADTPVSASENYRWGALISLGVILSAVSLWLPVWEAPNLADPRINRLPAEHEGWKVTERLPIDHDFFGSTRFTQTLLRTYSRGEEKVSIFIGLDDRLRGGNRAMSPKTVIPGSGWEIVSIDENLLPGEDWVIARSLRSVQLIHHQDLNMDTFRVEFARSLLGLGRGPFRRPKRPMAVRIQTDVASTPGGLEQAKLRLQDFRAAFSEPIAVYADATPAQG
jgi:exosortase